MPKQSAKARRAAAERQREKARTERDASGRLHLVLHRDAATGNEHLTLRRALFRDAWQNEVAVGAAQMAHAVVRDGASLEHAVALARNAMAATSRLAEGLLSQAPAGSVACRAGCDHCCYQVVGVTPPEALAIVDHLRRTLSHEELERLREHVTALFERTRGLSDAERFSPAHPCVFLRAGSCSVYEVRPLSCRGMNSLDATECATKLRDPEARATFLRDGRGGHSYLEPIRGAQAVSAGVQLGLSELHGLDMRPLDLVHAMVLLLGADQSLAAAWLGGGQPFASAVHESDDAGLREVAGTA
jgi:Fe-S-cluster containining protein